MKLRISMLAVVVALMSTGCSKFFVVKDKYDAVKKVALVQYAINPHMMLGTANADEAKFETAAKNTASFVKTMSGPAYTVMPMEELLANAGYKGKDAVEGYYTAKGMKFVTDDTKAIEAATLSPDNAKALCAALGVDGVAVIYDSWGMETYAFGFRGHTLNSYSFGLYDKDGTKVWSDTIYNSASEEGFPVAGGVIATDVATWVLNGNQSFEAALVKAKKNLGQP